MDIQYYIYNTDVTGGLITEHLLKAADRGVRVRLLIDDVGAELEDSRVSTVDIHPNIEVRLYNPLSLRSEWLKVFSKLGEFGRINYRMHNKLIVADNQALITGGRNIGDEYFALTDVDFQDVDVIGIGPISNDASDSFDNFWNSGIAIPINVMAQHHMPMIWRRYAHAWAQACVLQQATPTCAPSSARAFSPKWMAPA
ncbi:phospholipase D-like domain-containing protein [Halopseudomonas pachastrellae]|nr:phospholipase D-like domain-containing protein [Halopseudomonas pachastrellae]